MDGRQSQSPADHLFKSIATETKRDGVGIILSGSGTDGTLGLREINEAGGTTIVQKPSTADEPSMPEAAESIGVVDYVLSPNEIGHELSQLADRSVDQNEGEG